MNVLLIEDDRDDAFLFEHWLKRQYPDSTVTIAWTAEAAMDYFEAEGLLSGQGKRLFPTVIVLDLRLDSSITGIQVLAWIRLDPKRQDIPVVIWTSWDDRPNVQTLNVFRIVSKSNDSKFRKVIKAVAECCHRKVSDTV